MPDNPLQSKHQAVLRATAWMQERVKRARAHPANFTEFAMRTPKGKAIRLAQFHREWIDFFMTTRRGQIMASRGHGKTTIVIAFLIWIIGTNPNIRIKLFTQSEEKARERLTVIARLIERDKLVKLVFPNLARNPDGPWHKTSICVKRDIQDKEPTLEASGIMGSVEGGRVDLLVFDDISDYRNAILYPQNRESIKHKVMAEILPMLEVDGRAISIATPHTHADIIAMLEKNQEWASRRYPVGTEDDPFKPLWPEHWNREALEAKYREIGPYEFARAYRLEISADEMKMFKPEFIQFYDERLLGDPNSLVCIQSYDLAISEGKKANFFACVIFLYDPSRNIVFVADAWHDKIGFIEQADIIIHQARLWQPNAVAIEEIGYQSSLRRYLLERATEPLPIYPMKPGNLSKEVRFMETLPMLQNMRVYFHPKLDPQQHIERASMGDIIGELVDFPHGAQDDLVDAFVYGMRAIRLYQGQAISEEDQATWTEGTGVNSRVTLI